MRVILDKSIKPKFVAISFNSFSLSLNINRAKKKILNSNLNILIVCVSLISSIILNSIKLNRNYKKLSIIKTKKLVLSDWVALELVELAL